MVKDKYVSMSINHSSKNGGKMTKKTKKRIVTMFLLAAAALLIICGVYFIFFYNFSAYQRQATEERLADVFINYLLDNVERLDAAEEEKEGDTTGVNNSMPETAADNDMEEVQATAGNDGVIRTGYNFADDNYYERDGVTYTPDYAQGYLLCVLEYPNVGIRRGVYSGTWDDIYADLDMWMVTIAHPDMQPGQTHLAIYGHNHTSQNLSFNNLKNAQAGDVFYLYAESGIYTYEVANIFSDWRTDITRKYVDDFSVGSDICYIITCGRDNFLIGEESTRYKDFIVEGHLIEHTTLTEYARQRINEEEEQ